MNTCAICKKEIDESKELDGRPTDTTQGPVHEDCYFEAIGNEIEKHPLGRTPRGGRGCGHG